ncbi:MAG: dipicolinate synthase [Clostridia bacterium]|nr:dipicolinate synthase [Clostridia bacterium]
MNIGYKTFAIIGGDKRQLYSARSIADDGFEVILGGFDRVLSMRSVKILPPFEAAQKAEVVILPLPSVDKEGFIPASFSEEKISLKKLAPFLCGKRVFCAMKDKLIAQSTVLSTQLLSDYYEREDFVLSNAYVTAEGAIQIAMEKFEGTLNGAKILVCGFGRIGKALTRLLLAFSPKLTVSARKSEDLVAIRMLGAKAVKTSELEKEKGFDIIFSTVPALVFRPELLAKVASDALLIDLASMPGSVDFEAAKRLQIDCVHALSLPGKSSPKTAGEIIKDTVYTILEEEHR